MSDKELLELAAKAAGIEGVYRVNGYRGTCGINASMDAQLWNPLTNDGDALRLAVKLNISIEFTCCQDDAPVVWCRHWDYAQRHANFPDPYAATRRAIVQAAAEIGYAEVIHERLLRFDAENKVK